MEPIGDRDEPQQERREGRKRDPRDDDRPGHRRSGHPGQVELPTSRDAPEEDDRRPVEREREYAAELSPDESENKTDRQHDHTPARTVPFRPCMGYALGGAARPSRAHRAVVATRIPNATSTAPVSPSIARRTADRRSTSPALATTTA